MYLLNVRAFINRERAMSRQEEGAYSTSVLEFYHHELPAYAILSHRWIEPEVNLKEMAKLAKMGKHEQDRIRQRLGYKKILNACEQAKRDGYKWLWADTCCIDKRSSTELSEAINSMYRWYENSSACYAYLHDVSGPSFLTVRDDEAYPNSNGYPEWFSRGWTLQEMIAPSDVQFFNKDWNPIGDKRTLAESLSGITRVPQCILMDGLSFNRPCVAQIMSWAANRTTTRIEDRAYSLLGLLDVNMPMLYGEGKRAFYRLQLEIIRVSNDQSIFAWRGTERTGGVLADDPSFFRNCYEMRLMDPNRVIKFLNEYTSKEELCFEEDRFGVFPITNRGVQIWLLLTPLGGSRSVFQAWLPCSNDASGVPVRINLVLWRSNFYRYCSSLWDGHFKDRTLQFRQLYLRYQDPPYRDVTFEIDDSSITDNGLTYCGTYPSKLTENLFTLTNTDPLCLKVYSDGDCRFAVGFGQCFGKDWIHFIYEEHGGKRSGRRSWQNYAKEEYRKIVVRGPEHAQSMAVARSRRLCYDHLRIMQTDFPPTWTVRISRIVWKSSTGNCGIRIEVFRCPGLGSLPGKWTDFDVHRTIDPSHDMRGLMIRHRWGDYKALVDGTPVRFLVTPNGTKVILQRQLGDYGYFTDSKDFHCEGNIFADFKSLASEPVITPKQHKIDAMDVSYTDGDYVITPHRSSTYGYPQFYLHKPLGLALPNNHHFNSLLTSLSTQLTNRYLVTRVIQCTTHYSW
ncbi:heterokaryon incompatibility protein-domain-containing protein, partial [Scleroderma yunnanense]